MELYFKDSKLEEIYATGKSSRLHPDIIKLFIRRVNTLKASSSLRDIYAMVGLHCEKLSGDLEGKLSIRLNKGRRLIFTVDQVGNLQVIGVEAVTNHYQ